MNISFIHAADLHLGRVYSGLTTLPENIFRRLVDSAYRSLERIVTTAIAKKVDFVLIVGDLFDAQSVSLKAQLRLQYQLERLHKEKINTYISHGNHDPYHENQSQIEWPDSVFVFRSERVTAFPFFKQKKLMAYIYGFSYTRSEVYEDKSSEFIKAGKATYHIGMLHGHARGQAGHHPYAPFSITSLLQKDFDYWALGHIHKRMTLLEHPPIVYPGNIQGMHKKEVGEKGCMFVTLSPSTAQLRFIPTADIIWQEITVQITNLLTIDELLSVCINQIETVRSRGIDSFIQMVFTGQGPLHELLQEHEVIDDLLDYLRAGEEEKKTFVWVTDLDVQTLGHWDRNELKKRADFTSEIIHSLDEYNDLEEAMLPLTSHRSVRRYLTSLSEREKQEILYRVETLLLSELLKEQ